MNCNKLLRDDKDLDKTVRFCQALESGEKYTEELRSHRYKSQDQIDELNRHRQINQSK